MKRSGRPPEPPEGHVGRGAGSQASALPLAAAHKLADVATRSERVALLYVVFLFYGLPALLIFVSRSL